MDNKEISKELNSSMEKLLLLIDGFDAEQFNIVPFEGSWTAGQLAKHVVLFTAGFEEVLNGPIKDTDRPPDQFVERIKSDFLNFSTKMSSPDFILPPERSYDQKELSGDLKKNFRGILAVIESLDLTKTCTSFELPVYGFLTRLEAVYFVIYHTQRHSHQLENIRNKVLAVA